MQVYSGEGQDFDRQQTIPPKGSRVWHERHGSCKPLGARWFGATQVWRRKEGRPEGQDQEVLDKPESAFGGLCPRIGVKVAYLLFKVGTEEAVGLSEVELDRVEEIDSVVQRG
jgi:hypothetical protein